MGGGGLQRDGQLQTYRGVKTMITINIGLQG
jgi:hypothetical protein